VKIVFRVSERAAAIVEGKPSDYATACASYAGAMAVYDRLAPTVTERWNGRGATMPSSESAPLAERRPHLREQVRENLQAGYLPLAVERA
jgi:hypothetical protein